MAGKNDTAVGLAADLQLVSEFAGTDIVKVEYNGSHTQMRLQLKPGCRLWRNVTHLRISGLGLKPNLKVLDKHSSGKPLLE